MGILKTLYLDIVKNDLTTKNFNIRLTATKREYVEMTVKAKFEVWLGEWYRDRGIGVPYRTELLSGNSDYNIVETIFKGEATTVAYVLEVIGFVYEIDNASAEYSCTITLLIEGEEEGTQTVSIDINGVGG